MKIIVRRTQERVIKATTLPVELDTADFPEFKGRSEKAFLEYLAENAGKIVNSDAYYEHPVHLVVQGPMKVFYDSADHSYNGAFESGKIVEEQQENGWFETKKQIKVEIA